MKEHSYGIIPLKKYRGTWRVLLVKHGKKHWAFPKGHGEKNESPEETAIRELKEETGLDLVSFLPFKPLVEHYFFKKGNVLVEKFATYYLGIVKGKVVLQKEEIEDFKWLQVSDAEELATFKQTKELCVETLKLLKSL